VRAGEPVGFRWWSNDGWPPSPRGKQAGGESGHEGHPSPPLTPLAAAMSQLHETPRRGYSIAVGNIDAAARPGTGSGSGSIYMLCRWFSSVLLGWRGGCSPLRTVAPAGLSHTPASRSARSGKCEAIVWVFCTDARRRCRARRCPVVDERSMNDVWAEYSGSPHAFTYIAIGVEFKTGAAGHRIEVSGS